MHIFFLVPELLSLTLVSLPREDRVWVLRVSRLFFFSAVPLTWGCLHRASDLFMLIFDARLIDTNGSSGELIVSPMCLAIRTTQWALTQLDSRRFHGH
jgi:hypothetical protein